LAVSGNTAYVAGGSSGLQIVDVSDPIHPSYLGNYDTPGTAMRVTISEGIAYVADESGGLQIINVNNSTDPFFLSNYTTPLSALGVTVADNIAYVADSGSVQIIDVSNPSDPKFLSSYVTAGIPSGITTSNHAVYVAYVDGSKGGLQIIDVNNSTDPKLLGTYSLPAVAHGVTVLGDVAYVADDTSGLQIINVPQVPKLTGIPQEEDKGTLNVRVTVDDGRGGQIWDAYSLYVQHAPVVVNPLLDQTTLIGRNFEWIVPANTFNDTDGNALSYMVTRADGSPLPPWLNVENPIQPTLLGSLNLGGTSTVVAVNGNYAYVAQYGKLLAVDISSSSAPILVGSLDISKAMYVEVNNNFAYVVDETAGLKIIDISDPENPTLVGSFSSTPYGVDVIGNLVYLADLSAGLKIIDASNPTNPTLIGNIDTDYAGKVAVKDNLAYVTDMGVGLKIIDVSNATDPTLVGSLALSSPWEIEVDGIFAYVADSVAGLKIIDVSNVTDPTLVGSIATYNAIGVEVNGNFVYVADHFEGLKIIDSSNPFVPVLIGGLTTTDRAFTVTVNGNLAYVADGSAGLKIINVVEMPKLSGIPQEGDAGMLDIKVTADDGKGNQVSDVFDLNVRPIMIVDNPIPDQIVFVDQDFRFIIPENTFNNADGNVWSYNITLGDGNPLPEWLKVGGHAGQPTLLGSLDTDHACEITVNGDYAYVADGSGGVKIIDVSNTSAPVLKGTFSSSNARDIIVKDNYTYVADYAEGLKVIDISNVTNPTLIGSFVTYGAMGVEVNGSLAYVADAGAGLKIINISNPANLTLTGSIATYYAMKVEVNGNLAYVADAQEGIKIIDVSNATDPIVLGSYDTYGAYEVTVTDGLAYVADSQGGLKIIDVGNSSAPTLLSSIDANVYGVSVSGNYLYAADINDGLKIIDISNASAPILIGEFNTTAAEGIEVNGDLVYIADGDDGLKIIIPPILSGIPQEENLGTINIKITADDSKGNRASDIFTLEVKSGMRSSSMLGSLSSNLYPSSLPKPKSSSLPSSLSSKPSSSSLSRLKSNSSPSESTEHTFSSKSEMPSSSSTLLSESVLSSKSEIISSSFPTSQSTTQSKTSESSFTSESTGGLSKRSSSETDHSPGVTIKSLLTTILASIGGLASVVTAIIGTWFKYRKYQIASRMYQQNPFAAEIRKRANINVSDFESNEGQKYIKIVDNLASKLEEQGIDVKEMDQEELRTVTLHSVKVIKDKVKPQKSWLWHKRIPVDALEKAKKSITNKVIRKCVKETNQDGITLQISKGSGIIDSGELSKFKEIGQGAMGIVYKARYHGSDVAVKQLPIIAADSNELKQFEQEAELMKELRHPHVVNFYGYYQDQTHYSIVMEYVSGGSLDKVLYDTQQPFPWYPTRWDVAHDIASAVSFLHSNHIIHRDLKSQNVLVYRQDDRLRAKVADVGIAKIMKDEEMDTMTKGMGTPLWMAPEVIEAQGEKKKITYDEKVDIYSYGIILSELINRKAPFSEIDNFFKVIPQVLEGNRPAFDKESAPSNFVALMERCWSQRAAERPEIKEVVETLDQMEQVVQSFEC
jgi:tRNA A-37 threonylcarbamoyl transferase component Bud32